jgi:hypothetical protein
MPLPTLTPDNIESYGEGGEGGEREEGVEEGEGAEGEGEGGIAPHAKRINSSQNIFMNDPV